MGDEADTLGFEQAERLLSNAEFADCRPLWHSSNYVYLAQLCADRDQTFAAVYKPLRGESPLWDFPDGLYRREVAAYRLARLIGWNFVPPTVLRKDGPQGVGSLQLFIRHDPEAHFFAQREDPELVDQLQRMAVFDFVANNADRKGGHCLMDEDRRIWGIDHGLCFHEQYKLRTVIWDWAEEPVPEPWLSDVESAGLEIAAATPKAAPFLDLITKAERAALLTRIDRLLASRKFPAPGPHRHYPWPLV